ncbi:cytochrome b5 [Gonapodya prolifera JEL478]|uniref:Cytochrome b5 n=1 Tax=Gonapodya prolifera (strain JEL478) TaxID=1344416 RepID=A0A139AV00_GONPJ|nr:cytochrome b5 [Gonapodya prolifera JEL478]|eukprot:KXS20548.1 cytochrome b5 [Gonapodya prolifera JEL478]
MTSELRKRPTKGSKDTSDPQKDEQSDSSEKTDAIPKVGERLPQANPDYPVHRNIPPKGAGRFRRRVLDAVAKIPEPWKTILGVIYWTLFTAILIVLLYWFILGEITFELKGIGLAKGYVGRDGKVTQYATTTATPRAAPASTPAPKKKKAPPAPRPVPPPRAFTEAELAQFDGSDPEKPVYLAFLGKVYDVSANKEAYGTGQGYNMFAGRDAARAFVTGCFNEEDGHLTHDLRGLTEDEKSGLKEWGEFYEKEGKPGGKYPYVGTVIHDPIPSDKPIPKSCRQPKQ